MVDMDVVALRLRAQRLAGPALERAEDAVRALGAVQAQEYPGAKWALAQRTTGTTDAAINQAFADGAILRTHMLRPTWHFVTLEDIRWVQRLTAPRVHALNAYLYRKLELDAALLVRSHAVLTKALQGGRQLTRNELAAALQRARISRASDDSLRLAYIMMHAELECLICSGAMRGKQHTYALLDERAPQGTEYSRDEALAELVRRYFSTRGPATLKDFAWWSGLSQADGRTGLEMLKPQCAEVVMGEVTYWFVPDIQPLRKSKPRAHLLPAYDEYSVVYRNQGRTLTPAQRKQVEADYGALIVLEGQAVGSWKRIPKPKRVDLLLRLFDTLSDAQERALSEANERYRAFLALPVEVTRETV